MYVDGILSKEDNKEVLKIVERVNSERVYKDVQPEFSFYYEDQYGQIPTILGTYATEVRCSSNYELRKKVKEKKDAGIMVFESDVNVIFKTLDREYRNCESPTLNKVYFDIETDFDQKFGYAPPDDPFNRVTAISLSQSWTGETYVLAIQPKTLDFFQANQLAENVKKTINDENSYVIICENEKDMFLMFFELISDADILTGWNSEFFDIPYLVNRTKRIFYERMTSLFCLWDKLPIPKETEYYGKTSMTYNLVGRVHFDYLALYKKHAGQVKQSYKLDDIGYEELKENKVAYEGTLDHLYNHDFEKFLLYAYQDTRLLVKLDNKLDFINLHNNLAHQECVTLATTMGTVGLVDTAVVNEAHRNGNVVFDKKPMDDDPDDYTFDIDDYEDDDDDEFDEIDDNEKCTAKAAGAWVQDPVTGLISMIGCTDFNSLYPTVLRSLGMSTECILGQIRQDYTERYLNEQIEKQRASKKSKKFKPNWTEAWHGLFAVLEYTMVMNKTDDVLFVDLEDGTSFKCTAKELYDIIFSEDSNIVLSANGTLFDKKRYGVIPSVLTRWYTERKQMQGMFRDYRHLYNDGLELPNVDKIIESYNKLKEQINEGRIFRTKVFEDDPIYKLRVLLKEESYDELAKLIISNNLYFDENKKLWIRDNDVDHAKFGHGFWEQNQQIRKILLNSLYGALLNKSSRFFDKRLGQSVTLTGRTMTKHMASMINEFTTGEYNHVGGSVIYGDSVTGESMIDIKTPDGEFKSIPIEELYNQFLSTEFLDKGTKNYVRTPDLLVKTYDKKRDIVYYDNAKSIMRHKTNKSLFNIKTETKSINCTSDHSVLIELDGELIECTPYELQEIINSGETVYMITTQED